MAIFDLYRLHPAGAKPKTVTLGFLTKGPDSIDDVAAKKSHNYHYQFDIPVNSLISQVQGDSSMAGWKQEVKNHITIFTNKPTSKTKIAVSPGEINGGANANPGKSFLTISEFDGPGGD